MPNNESQTEEVANSAKKILKNTVGKTLKLLLVPIMIISIILILLVSFLKIIWEADTADQMMDKDFVEDATEEAEEESD